MMHTHICDFLPIFACGSLIIHPLLKQFKGGAVSEGLKWFHRAIEIRKGCGGATKTNISLTKEWLGWRRTEGNTCVIDDLKDGTNRPREQLFDAAETRAALKTLGLKKRNK